MKKVALLSLFALVFGAFAVAQCPVESGYTCAFYAGDAVTVSIYRAKRKMDVKVVLLEEGRQQV